MNGHPVVNINGTSREALVNALTSAVESLRLRELLKDIEAHLSGGAALYPGSLIFAEDAPAIEVIRAATKS